MAPLQDSATAQMQKPRLRKKGDKIEKGAVHVYLVKGPDAASSVLSIYIAFDHKVVLVPQGTEEYAVSFDTIGNEDTPLFNTTVLTFTYRAQQNGKSDISRSYTVEQIGSNDFLTIVFEEEGQQEGNSTMSTQTTKSTIYYGGAE